jgi:hypothetical protein
MLFGVLGGYALRQFLAAGPEVDGMIASLRRLSQLEAGSANDTRDERHALEVYIAGRYRDGLHDEQLWGDPVLRARLQPVQALADRVRAAHPVVDVEQLDAASVRLAAYLEKQRLELERQARILSRLPAVAPAAAVAAGLACAAFFGILVAAPLRGGLSFRIAGLAVVDTAGRPAGRARALWRSLVAWAPAIVVCAVGFQILVDVMRDRPVSWWPVAVSMAIALAGTAFAILRPSRGLQDRLAGTFVTPR